jgi:hypothetical protein
MPINRLECQLILPLAPRPLTTPTLARVPPQVQEHKREVERLLEHKRAMYEAQRAAEAAAEAARKAEEQRQVCACCCMLWGACVLREWDGMGWDGMDRAIVVLLAMCCASTVSKRLTAADCATTAAAPLQAAIISDERKRLLAEAAGLLGHLPPGIIRTAEEMQYVQQLAAQRQQ